MLEHAQFELVEPSELVDLLNLADLDTVLFRSTWNGSHHANDARHGAKLTTCNVQAFQADSPAASLGMRNHGLKQDRLGALRPENGSLRVVFVATAFCYVETMGCVKKHWL